MKAVVVDKGSPSRVRLAEVAEPEVAADEALIDVRASSLNLGETRRTMTVSDDGVRPGWDVAGVVVTGAKDGRGPQAGARVVGFLPDSGGWAERAAVAIDALAELPATVSFEVAATLPVAGLTALYALDRGGSLLGKRVLITGASGGVGVFALQIARASGAHVTGLVRRADTVAVARTAGAHEVIVSEDGALLREHEPFDHVLESVGGTVFTHALERLADDAELVVFGTSAEKAATIDVSQFYSSGGHRLYGFILFHEVETHSAAAGLARLVRLVADGSLRPKIDRTYPFDQIGEAIEALWQRRINGKVVVTMGR